MTIKLREELIKTFHQKDTQIKYNNIITNVLFIILSRYSSINLKPTKVTKRAFKYYSLISLFLRALMNRTSPKPKY